MARRRGPVAGRAELVWAAWSAAWLDRATRRITGTSTTVDVAPMSPRTMAALEPLTEDERRFVLALADGTLGEPGCVVEIIERHYGASR